MATGSQGAAGFASLFVAAYLRAGEGDEDTLAAFFPGAADLRLEGAPNRRSGEQLTVVRLRQTDAAVWSVTVAAQVTTAAPSDATPTPTAMASPDASARVGGELRYFQVPVATGPAAGGATGYVALSMPAEVSAPPRIAAPDLVYGLMQPASPADARTQAVIEFLTAYLTGSGELDRYLAPGVQVSPIRPAPYTALSVDQLAVEGAGGAESETNVPVDGTTLRLLVSVHATGSDQVRVPLTYALTLKSRAGRWEIASLDGAPAPAPAAGARTAAAPSRRRPPPDFSTTARSSSCTPHPSPCPPAGSPR